MQFKTLLKIYYRKIFFWIFLSTVFVVSIQYGIDKKIIVFVAFVISVFTACAEQIESGFVSVGDEAVIRCVAK